MESSADHPLRPAVSAWQQRIKFAVRHKQPFQAIADECMLFFSQPTGFLWDEKFRHRFKLYLGSEGGLPRFRMSVNKAFEFVALMGPALYRRNPTRTCIPRKSLAFPPDIFGDPNDPYAMMAYQQMLMAQTQEERGDVARSLVMRELLNYFAQELPGGGLETHGRLWVTEAMIKGRGVLWTGQYTTPLGSAMTGSKFDSTDNLLIDPDAELVSDAWWIAQRVIEPRWAVAERRGIKPEELKSVYTSADKQARDMGDEIAGKLKLTADEKSDLVVYYRVWSKMGIGGRLTGLKTDNEKTLEAIFGDYCYLEIADDLPYPLNLPTDTLLSDIKTPEEKRAAVSWPEPYWAYDRWPMTELDFNVKPRSLWPVAPLEPGLGELKFLNVMMGHLANRIWLSSRNFYAVLKSAAEDIKKAILTGNDLTLIEVDAKYDDINKVIRVLEQPQTNKDVWLILAAVSKEFDKRVGLSEAMYGMQATSTRSAAETNAKQQQISVRPEQMGYQVRQALREVARKEALCARFSTEATLVAKALGMQAGFVWDKYILQEDVEKVVWGMDYQIEEDSAPRPNKERDAQNMIAAMQQWLPVLMNYLGRTNDVEPVNAMMDKWGTTFGMDVSDMKLKPPPPMPMPMGPGGPAGPGGPGMQPNPAPPAPMDTHGGPRPGAMANVQ